MGRITGTVGPLVWDSLAEMGLYAGAQIVGRTTPAPVPVRLPDKGFDATQKTEQKRS